ncbi:hypothetical protein CTAYLR_008474 [Chrysophaeum taylorii]|uniref:RRM domain-containing protein n=1 Tax=Chrysophaeum taylorii TaxID=2483200 RepID=A0AAD7UHL8_9STRA|nr:hypothetical protein CTAYLR_008474 [Chrysophaeum taylorii]
MFGASGAQQPSFGGGASFGGGGGQQSPFGGGGFGLGSTLGGGGSFGGGGGASLLPSGTGGRSIFGGGATFGQQSQDTTTTTTTFGGGVGLGQPAAFGNALNESSPFGGGGGGGRDPSPENYNKKPFGGGGFQQQPENSNMQPFGGGGGGFFGQRPQQEGLGGMLVPEESNVFGGSAFGQRAVEAPFGGEASKASFGEGFGAFGAAKGSSSSSSSVFGATKEGPFQSAKTGARAAAQQRRQQPGEQSWPAAAQKDPAKAVVVSRVPATLDEATLRAAFEGFGGIRSVKVARQQGRHPIAYVNFEDARGAERAARETSGTDLFQTGKTVQVAVQQARAQAQAHPQAGSHSPPQAEAAAAASYCLKLQPLPPSCSDEQLRRVLEQRKASSGLQSVKTIHRDGRAYGWANYATKRDAAAAAGVVKSSTDLFPGFSAPIHATVRRAQGSTPGLQQQQQPPQLLTNEGGPPDASDEEDEELGVEEDEDYYYGEDINAKQHKTAIFNTSGESKTRGGGGGGVLPPKAKGSSMSRTVRVDGLPRDATEARLKSIFDTFGEVSLVAIQKEGYGLVMFNEASHAELAVEQLHGIDAFSSGPLDVRVCSSTTTTTTAATAAAAARSTSPPQRRPARRRGPAPARPNGDEPPAAAIVGTCEQMCPQSEIEERARHNELDAWEKPPPAAFLKSSNNLEVAAREFAVKRYKRSDAGSIQNVPELVRPPRVLLATLDHLETHVVSKATTTTTTSSSSSEGSGDEGLSTYLFLWDRFRAIRKDFILQNYTKGGLVDETVVDVFERMARYFIAMERRMAAHPEWRAGPAHGKHNAESLSEILTALLAFYDMAHARGVVVSEHEAEVTAYWILFFGDNDHDAGQLLSRLAATRPSLYSAPEVATAAAARSCRARLDYFRFFSIARASPYLVKCLLVALMARGVRAAALSVMGRAYAKGEPYPLSRLARVLGSETVADAADAARDAGLRVARTNSVVYLNAETADEDLAADEPPPEPTPASLRRSGIFDDGDDDAPLREIVSPSAEELRARAARRRAAEKAEREAREAAAAADRAKRDLEAKAALEKRRLEAEAEKRRAAELDRERRRLEARAAERARRALEDRRRREAEDRRLREAEDRRRRIEAERRAAEARRIREAEARRLEAEALERERRALEDAERRRVDALNERRATAHLKRTTLRKLERRARDRRNLRRLDAARSAALWLRLWHHRAMARVAKRGAFDEVVASFSHGLAWETRTLNDDDDDVFPNRRKRPRELPGREPRRLRVDVSRAVAQTLLGMLPDIPGVAPPDVVWRLAVLGGDAVLFDPGDAPGVRVLLGPPANAAVAVIADDVDIVAKAAAKLTTTLEALAVVCCFDAADAAPLATAAPAVVVVPPARVDQALRWLALRTARLPAFVRADAPSDLVLTKAAERATTTEKSATDVRDRAIRDFNDAVSAAASSLRDSPIDADEVPTGPRAALVPVGPRLVPGAPLPADWRDRTDRCAAALLSAQVPPWRPSATDDYVAALDPSPPNALGAALRTALEQPRDYQTVFAALVAARLAPCPELAYQRIDDRYDLGKPRHQPSLPTWRTFSPPPTKRGPQQPRFDQIQPPPPPPRDHPRKHELLEALARHRRANAVFERQLRSGNLGFTLALARRPPPSRGEPRWCTLSIVHVEHPNESSALFPTDELVGVNGATIAIRDDDNLDDLDRIVAFGGLKQMIQMSRPVDLKFVRGEHRAVAMAELLERRAMTAEDVPAFVANLVLLEGERLRSQIADQIGGMSCEVDNQAARTIARAVKALEACDELLAPRLALLEARATDAYVTARRRALVGSTVARGNETRTPTDKIPEFQPGLESTTSPGETCPAVEPPHRVEIYTREEAPQSDNQVASAALHQAHAKKEKQRKFEGRQFAATVQTLGKTFSNVVAPVCDFTRTTLPPSSSSEWGWSHLDNERATRKNSTTKDQQQRPSSSSLMPTARGDAKTASLTFREQDDWRSNHSNHDDAAAYLSSDSVEPKILALGCRAPRSATVSTSREERPAKSKRVTTTLALDHHYPRHKDALRDPETTTTSCESFARAETTACVRNESRRLMRTTPDGTSSYATAGSKKTNGGFAVFESREDNKNEMLRRGKKNLSRRREQTNPPSLDAKTVVLEASIAAMRTELLATRLETYSLRARNRRH